MAPDQVEQPSHDVGVGSPPHAASDAGARLGSVRLRAAAWRQLRRAALSQHLCQYTCLSHFWPSRPYRHGGHTVFLGDVVALCGSMAEPQPEECPTVWPKPGGCPSFAVDLG